MGKRRQPGPKNSGGQSAQKAWYWCYYCNAEAKDEATLIQHQVSKHFLCQFCDKHAKGRQCMSLAGLISHVRRSHRKDLYKVPGAIEGRDSLEVHVCGMSGIPDDVWNEMEETDGPEVAEQPAPNLRSELADALANIRPPSGMPSLPKAALPKPQAAPATSDEPALRESSGSNTEALESLTQVEALASGKLDAIAKALVAAAATNTSVKAAAVEGAATKALLAAAAASKSPFDGNSDVAKPAAGEPLAPTNVPDAVAPSAPALPAAEPPSATAVANTAEHQRVRQMVQMQMLQPKGGPAAKASFTFRTTAPPKTTDDKESVSTFLSRMAANAKASSASVKAGKDIVAQEPGRKKREEPEPPPVVEQPQQMEVPEEPVAPPPQAQPQVVQRGRSRSRRRRRSDSRGRRRRRRDYDSYESEEEEQLLAIPQFQEPQGEFSGGKQVACRFGWAHFVKPGGQYYYVNVLNGEKRRTLPESVLFGMK